MSTETKREEESTVVAGESVDRQLTQTIKMSQSFGKLVGALAKAQGEFGKVLKDITAKIQTKNGGSYSYQYADLASVLEAIRKPLADHGLAVMQPTSCNGDRVSITTILSHESGEWISSSLVLPVEPNNDKQPFVQAVGSTLTYGKRYALCGLLGISSEADDDGNNTGPRGNATRPNGVNRQPQQSQQTRTASSEELNQKYNNPNRANAPAPKIEQPKQDAPKQEEKKPSEPGAPSPAAAPAPTGDPAQTLKNTLFRFYACTKKEDCDVLLREVSANEEKGLDYYVGNPDECGEILQGLEFYAQQMQCEKRHLLAEVRKRQQQSAAI